MEVIPSTKNNDDNSSTQQKMWDENIATNREKILWFLEDYGERFPKGLSVFLSTHHVEFRICHPAVMNGERCGDTVPLNMNPTSFREQFEFKFNYLKRKINVWNKKQTEVKIEPWYKKYDLG